MKKKSDETRAAVVCTLWALCFVAGMFIAAIQNAKPFGITLMFVSTLVLALYLWADDRIEQGKKLHKRYVEEMTRQEIEARERRGHR